MFSCYVYIIVHRENCIVTQTCSYITFKKQFDQAASKQVFDNQVTSKSIGVYLCFHSIYLNVRVHPDDPRYILGHVQHLNNTTQAHNMTTTRHGALAGRTHSHQDTTLTHSHWRGALGALVWRPATS